MTTSLWELVPTAVDSSVWRFARYKGTVVVRARDEDHARVLASERFQTGPLPSEDGRGVVIGNPWYSAMLVACNRLPPNDARWPVEGPSEVVFPGT